MLLCLRKARRQHSGVSILHPLCGSWCKWLCPPRCLADPRDLSESLSSTLCWEALYGLGSAFNSYLYPGQSEMSDPCHLKSSLGMHTVTLQTDSQEFMGFKAPHGLHIHLFFILLFLSAAVSILGECHTHSWSKLLNNNVPVLGPLLMSKLWVKSNKVRP